MRAMFRKNISGHIATVILLTGTIVISSCQKELSCESCNKVSHPPVANAGRNSYIILPADITELDGSASSDPDNNIKFYKWRKISGPASFKILDPNAAKTSVDELVQGIFQFELQVTDSTNLSSKDTVQVTVAIDTISNTPPPGCYSGDCRGHWICMPDDKFQEVIFTASPYFPGAFGAATSNGSTLFFGGGHEEGYIGFTESAVNIYNTVSSTWTLKSLSIGRSHLSAASCGNKVLFAGGNNIITAYPIPPYPIPLEYYKTVDIFDASNYTHTTTELSEARGYMAAVSTPDQAFFIGGKTINGYSSKMDIYNSGNDSWSVVDLPRPRANAAAVIAGDKIIIAGGANAGGNLKIADVYDLNSKTWSQMDIPHEHPIAAMALVMNKILIAGGNGLDNRSVDIYDLNTSTWSYAELSDSRYDIAVAVANNTVLFLGGNYSCHVDIYKAATGEWQTTQLNQAVSGVAAATTGKVCGFAGFLYRNGDALTNTVIMVKP
jgi:hypothetical protein